jgi:hypothetical protein
MLVLFVSDLVDVTDLVEISVFVGDLANISGLTYH